MTRSEESRKLRPRFRKVPGLFFVTLTCGHPSRQGNKALARARRPVVTVRMARTATATATAKRGGSKGTKKPAAPLKKKAKRSPRGRAKDAASQSTFLETVKAENPNISSDEFALKFNLPVDEVSRMRAFVYQFSIDFDAKKAALRMGYPEATALDTGKIWLGNAFVQLLLSEIQRNAGVETVATVGQLASKVWEEANRPDTVRDGCVMSNSASRLSALTLYAKILGLFNPKPKEPEGGNVRRVMHVPLVAVVGDWGAMAHASQKALKAQTVVDV